MLYCSSNAKIIVFVSSIAEAVALQHFLSRMTMPTRKSSSRMGGTAASSVKDWTSADFGSGGIDDDEQHEESGVDDDAGNLDYTKRSSQGSNSSKSAYKADSDEDADDFDSKSKTSKMKRTHRSNYSKRSRDYSLNALKI